MDGWERHVNSPSAIGKYNDSTHHDTDGREQVHLRLLALLLYLAHRPVLHSRILVLSLASLRSCSIASLQSGRSSMNVSHCVPGITDLIAAVALCVSPLFAMEFDFFSQSMRCVLNVCRELSGLGWSFRVQEEGRVGTQLEEQVTEVAVRDVPVQPPK